MKGCGLLPVSLRMLSATMLWQGPRHTETTVQGLVGSSRCVSLQVIQPRLQRWVRKPPDNPRPQSSLREPQTSPSRDKPPLLCLAQIHGHKGKIVYATKFGAVCYAATVSGTARIGRIPWSYTRQSCSDPRALSRSSAWSGLEPEC